MDEPDIFGTVIEDIADRILKENGYVLEDFPNLTLEILEYKIDDAIDWVNLRAGTEIQHLDGGAGEKSIIATDGEILMVKWLTNAMLRAYKEKGTQMGLSGLSITQVINDSDSVTTKLILKEVDRLRQPPIYVANDPVP